MHHIGPIDIRVKWRTLRSFAHHPLSSFVPLNNTSFLIQLYETMLLCVRQCACGCGSGSKLSIFHGREMTAVAQSEVNLGSQLALGPCGTQGKSCALVGGKNKFRGGCAAAIP